MLPGIIMTGMPVHLALGTNKLYTTASLLTSTRYFFKQNNLQLKLWLPISIAAMVGSAFGAGLAFLVDDATLKKILPLFIAAMAVYLLVNKKQEHVSQYRPELHCRKKKKSMVVGKLLGIYSGFLGAGTGTLCSIALMRMFKMDVCDSSMVSRLICFTTNISALIVFVALGNVDYKLGLFIAILGSIGAYWGSFLSVKYGKKLIGNAMLVMTILTSVGLSVEAWI